MRIPLAAAILGICLIVAVAIAGNAIKYRSRSTETIVVTGLAEKDFVSDLIVWQGSYSRRSFELQSAYTTLKSDEATIRQYLKSKGVADAEMIFSAVQINKEFNTRTNEHGMQMSQE